MTDDHSGRRRPLSTAVSATLIGSQSRVGRSDNHPPATSPQSMAHSPTMLPDPQVASQQPLSLRCGRHARSSSAGEVSRTLVANDVVDVSRGVSWTSFCAPHHLKACCAAAVEQAPAVLNHRDRHGGMPGGRASYHIAALARRRRWRSGTSAAVETARRNSGRHVGRSWPRFAAPPPPGYIGLSAIS